MPLDNTNATPGKSSSKITKRTSRLSSLAEDICPPDDAPFRMRLHLLFAQIEKEFETLYLENLSRKCLLSCTQLVRVIKYNIYLFFAVQEKLDGISGSGVREGTSSGDRFVSQDYLEADIVSNKSLKSKLGAAGSKGSKASHKLRAQTSRIVSSFKGQSVLSSIVREFCGHKDGVWQVTSKGPVIGTASADHTACIWGIDTGRCLLQYQGHGGSVNSIKFHATKELVLTGSGDGTAHIWQGAVKYEIPSRKGHSSEEELDDDDDPIEGDRVDVLRTPLCEFGGPGGHSSVVVAADWLPGCDQIITASWDRSAILWDVETKEPLQSPLTGHDHELTHASAHPTQRLVVTASRDSTFRLWDFRDQIPAVSVFQGHTE